jgi:hypothetical protein
MKNVLDIELSSDMFSLKDYIEEIGMLPLLPEVKLYAEKVRNYFVKYQDELRNILMDKNTLTEFNRIIEVDVILYYLYDTYTNSSEEFVNQNFFVDEKDILSSWSNSYLQELEYPKILKLFY